MTLDCRNFAASKVAPLPGDVLVELAPPPPSIIARPEAWAVYIDDGVAHPDLPSTVEGIVRKIGPGPSEVVAGNRVVFPSRGGWTLKHSGKVFKILPMTSLLAVYV